MNAKTIKKIQKDLEQSKKININDKTDDIKKKNKDYTEKITNSDNESVESNSNEPQAQYEFMEEFKELIKTYIEDDDKIRDLRASVKKITNKQKKLSDEIIVHLERMGRNNLNLGGKSGGKLIINKYTSKGTLNKDLIEETLEEQFKDPKITESILNKIEDKKNQNLKTRIQLKRTFEHKK